MLCGEAACEAPAEGHIPGSGMESPWVVATRVAHKSFGLGQAQWMT